MKQEQVIWAGGINRSRDPRYIENYEQYLAYNLEVIRRGTLSKRKGFGRYTTDLNSLGSLTLPICGVHLMYNSDGVRYLFVFVDASPGVDLYVEKSGTFVDSATAIADFFPSKGTRIRSAVFGDKIYFVNGQDRPRWYQKYDSGHIWGIGGVPSPARRPADETSYDFEVTRAQFAEHITGSEGLGIESPGIFRYKQTVGYFGKENTEQIEESNAGPASKPFVCQFNTEESLSTTLSGYVKKGISLGIADHDDLILVSGESGQDYGAFIRWMRLYRQWKMFSDELYSPFELLIQMNKGWPTSINDVYSRDSAMVAPTTRVSLPVAHHIEKANNRLFLGRVEKELFSQPGLPADFRGETTYKANFTYRMPITITNTNSKTLTGAIISLRFHDDEDNDTDTIATPPSGGGTWRGAYIETDLDIETTDWYQMVFVDEDGVTPLGFFKVGTHTYLLDHDITFLVEIPEIAAGGSRTIYLYFEDSQLDLNPESYSGQPGHWLSLAHYPLLSSDHLLLMDFENWETGMAMTDVTQKRSLGYLEQGPVGLGTGVADISKSVTQYFFNDTTYSMGAAPNLDVRGDSTSSDVDCVMANYYPPGDTANVLSFAFLVYLAQTAGAGGSVWLASQSDPENEISVKVDFADGAGGTLDVTATAYYDGGNTSTGAINITIPDQFYIAVVATLTTLTLYVVAGDNSGHPAEGTSLSAAWDITGYITDSDEAAFTGPVLTYSAGMVWMAFGCNQENVYTRFKEIQVLNREIDGFNELIAMWNHDTYWPNSGLATMGDRESSSSADKYPDRFYFSGLNTPNSFDAVDFRDLGNKGHPIQGIKGLQNRVFIFTPSEVRALFSAGSEYALALGSGDVTMWNLSQDLTGELGGLGVLAPDTLINMEFAGKDGIGFLSVRGYHFFDGEGFAHLSQKIDNILKDEGDNDRLEYATAHYLAKKRQLIISTLNYVHTSSVSNNVANLMYARSVDEIVWTRWGTRIALGVELDSYLDDGSFVYGCVQSITPFLQQLLKLEGDGTYIDKKYGSPTDTNVTAEAWSKHFEVFDSELLKIDFVIDKASAVYDSYFLRVREANVAGTQQGTTIATITNPQNAMILLPIGTHAKKLMFELYEQSADAVTFHGFTFFYNQHGHRRL